MKMPTPKIVPVKKINTAKRAPTHTGPIGKAKILTKDQMQKAADIAMNQSVFGMRDRLFVMLSRYGAMRAAEIAAVKVEDFTDAEGKPIPKLVVNAEGAKYGKPRTIDIPPVLVEALAEYQKESGIETGALFYGWRGDRVTSNAVQKQIAATYARCGFKGARSHSGRRTAITTLAQTINTIGGSLEDVRIFAGHSDLKTTAGYIESSPHGPKMAAQL